MKLCCNCGEVVISTALPPTYRTECCCVDCRKALKWCESRGGRNPPPLVDLLYFPNALKVDRGRDRLCCYLLKKGYDTRRVVATCCWTSLVADHPSYKGKVFNLCNWRASLALADQKALPPVFRRLFQSDMTAEELAALPPESPPPIKPVKKRTDSKAKTSHLLCLQGGRFITIQNLIDSLGNIEFMDSQYEGPPTHWSKMVRESTLVTSSSKL